MVLVWLSFMAIILPASNGDKRVRSGYFCIENYDPTIKGKKKCKIGTGGFTPSACIGLGGCFPEGTHGAGGPGAYSFTADGGGNIWLDTWKSSTTCEGAPLKTVMKTKSYFCVNITAETLTTLIVYDALPNYGTGTLVTTTYLGGGCSGPAISITIEAPTTLKAKDPVEHCKQVACKIQSGNAAASIDKICTVAPYIASAYRGKDVFTSTIIAIGLSVVLMLRFNS